MKSLFPIAMLVAGLTVAVGAQDQTVTSKTKVKGDDARVVTLSGCLQSSGNDLFTLQNAMVASGDEARMKSKVKTDNDDDRTKVERKSKTEVNGDDDARVGTSGTSPVYELTPKQGVDLASHVGQRVQITAVALDAKTKHDDDAKLRMKEKTKIEQEGAPDSKSESRTKAELPRGDHPRMVAMSVTQIGACQP